MNEAGVKAAGWMNNYKCVKYRGKEDAEFQYRERGLNDERAGGAAASLKNSFANSCERHCSGVPSPPPPRLYLPDTPNTAHLLQSFITSKVFTQWSNTHRRAIAGKYPILFATLIVRDNYPSLCF